MQCALLSSITDCQGLACALPSSGSVGRATLLADIYRDREHCAAITVTGPGTKLKLHVSRKVRRVEYTTGVDTCDLLGRGEYCGMRLCPLSTSTHQGRREARAKASRVPLPADDDSRGHSRGHVRTGNGRVGSEPNPSIGELRLRSTDARRVDATESTGSTAVPGQAVRTEPIHLLRVLEAENIELHRRVAELFADVAILREQARVAPACAGVSPWRGLRARRSVRASPRRSRR